MSRIGFQCYMFWGIICSVQILKVGVPNVGFKPLTPWGKALGFEFAPNCGLQYRGGVYGLTVSQPLPPALMVCGYTLAQCVGVAQPVL